MDDEKLIEIVKNNTVLYDLENSKYSDIHYKEKIWSDISKELNVELGSTCKNRWNQLRDQWRKNIKKQLTNSGQANKPVKKWRYEDQMEFLRPFSCQRETIGNPDCIVIENEEIAEEENAGATETQENNLVPEAHKNTKEVTNSPAPQAVPTPIPNRQVFSSRLYEPPKRKPDESATDRELMKYLAENQRAEQMNLPPAATFYSIDRFFETITDKIKRFTPYYRNIAESKIFNLVQAMELEQIQISNRRSNVPSQFQQQQQTAANNNNNFHNLLPLQPPTPSSDTSTSSAASYVSSFYDNSNGLDI